MGLIFGFFDYFGLNCTLKLVFPSHLWAIDILIIKKSDVDLTIGCTVIPKYT